MSRPSDRLRFAALVLAGLLMLEVAFGEAQPPVRQVLVLQSFDRGNLVLDQFTGDFRVDLVQGVKAPVNVVQVTIGPTGFVVAPEQAVVDFIRSTFADRPKPDLIVTVSAPAALFARKYRQQLFPDTPLLFTTVDQRFLGNTPLAENEVAVAVVNDFPKLVDDILQVLPQTKQVFMVMGSGPIGRLWRQEVEKQFRRFHDRVTFLWSDDMSFAEILRRSASLPEHSAIFYFSLGADATGTAYADERVLAELHATANAPLFGAHSVHLGTGAVGGTLMSVEDLTRNSADAAIRILNGESPSTIRVALQLPGPPIFDWRELQRWRIPESRLPPGSEVRYQPPSLWQEHSVAILIAAGALAIQAFLIVGLLLQRRARQRAEIESRRNLALAADASRRETMSALSHTIGHELGQPLTSMIYNAQALQMMVTANRATSDTLVEILSEIHAQGVRAGQIIDRHRKMLRSRQMQKKSIDLHAVVNEGLALVAHELGERQIETIIDVPSTPCVLNGDQVLLQQVLVNLLMNAMDAMSETPPARRHLTIRSEVRAAEVKVSVRDTGPGLPADIIDTLFKPFVTTKSHGLGIGLTITRTIVAAHGGTIEAQNNPEGGATFTFTLPCSEKTSKPSAARVVGSAASEASNV